MRVQINTLDKKKYVVFPVHLQMLTEIEAFQQFIQNFRMAGHYVLEDGKRSIPFHMVSLLEVLGDESV